MISPVGDTVSLVRSEWNIEITNEALAWYEALPERTAHRFEALLDELADKGPTLTRPTSDVVKGTDTPYTMYELRTGTIRVLYVFDPHQTAVVLVGGDKSEHGFKAWYKPAIAEAKALYDRYLTETDQQ